MKQLRSSRHLIKMWHRREKAAIARGAPAVDAAPKTVVGTVHSAFTPCGLAVEEQVRKAWQPGPLGLALF
jgi:hypothetical protein